MKTKKLSSPERTVIIHLFAGGTPKQLRSAMQQTHLLANFSLAPRVMASWLRNGRETLSNAEIAARIAQSIPASTIHVFDMGPISNAFGPNLPPLLPVTIRERETVQTTRAFI